MALLPFRRDGFVALSLVAVPLLLFGVLAFGVRDGRTFSWDRVLVEFFDEHYYDVESLREATEALIRFSLAAGAVLAAIFFVVLLGRGLRRQALFWALAIGGVAALTPILKWLFQRPQIGDPEGGYSFPSGNAMASLAVVAALFLLLSASRWRRLVAFGGALVPAYGLALVFLLWHYPSDVVAGWCFALAWVTGAWVAFGAPLPTETPSLGLQRLVLPGKYK